MDKAIEIKGINKNYGDFQLKDVSFSLSKGSIMGFIGENGAGKTTTLKLILNLIKRDSGSIKVMGLDNIKDEKAIKDNIGVVLDDSFFHDNLTPLNINKIMSKIYSKWDEKEYISYIQRFKLPKDKIVKDFSKGMKMKLSIAVALSHKAKLLILDEATSGLDPVVRNEILDVFLDFIQDEENSVLISSHIISDLEKVADYITFIHDGEIVFCESKDVLLYEYGIFKCGLEDFNKLNKKEFLGYEKNTFGYRLLARNKDEIIKKYPYLTIDSTNIEDIMLLTLRGERK